MINPLLLSEIAYVVENKKLDSSKNLDGTKKPEKHKAKHENVWLFDIKYFFRFLDFVIDVDST